MFKIKIQSNFTKSLVAFVLIFFVISRAVLMLHDFSHQEFKASKSAVVKVSQADQSFFQKVIFAHEKSSGKKSEHCFFCATSNFQNQISLTASLIFCVAAFQLAYASRNFDSVKLSYLLSSKAPRAPPVIS